MIFAEPFTPHFLQTSLPAASEIKASFPPISQVAHDRARFSVRSCMHVKPMPSAQVGKAKLSALLLSGIDVPHALRPFAWREVKMHLASVIEGVLGALASQRLRDKRRERRHRLVTVLLQESRWFQPLQNLAILADEIDRFPLMICKHVWWGSGRFSVAHVSAPAALQQALSHQIFNLSQAAFRSAISPCFASRRGDDISPVSSSTMTA
ncbi:hypothetical protein FBZ99_1213 [Rhizobium sp. ERR 1071]|nr:hypothetical protein FBZ99_1213 [Rhizobium sp. ERR1071]